MKKMQSLILLLALVLLGFSAALRAEDTDIYVDGAANMGVPNLLFVIDNGANFSANAKIGCSVYTGTTEAPSLGTSTAAGVEQCALVDALNALADGSINIGILVSNGNDFATDVRAAGDDAYHETCSTDTGGCLIRKMTVMNAANKASLIKFIKSWKLSGQNSATEFNIKVNTALPGTMMQEAWAYLNGKVGMSGTSYSPSLLGTGCQKNFIVYIANAEKSPANESPSPYDGTNALTSAQASATADQKIKLSNTVKFDPAACGATSAVATTANGNWSENWADEWSRLMFQQDGGATAAEGRQNIISYTVGILNNDTCTPDYPALLSNMAAYGGGKFFPTSNVSDVTTALQKILNEVQAVNSVFSSASLPVSVNAEGTFLNQIFLGMFRPDSSGAPRWQGNLKQYQLIKDASGSLIMGDAQGNAAISSAGTGFISPNAISFWTKKMTSTAPDNAGGFFVNDKKGVPESGYDSPDGEVVEKGGVSQQQRLESLTADFGATAGGSSNPRRLYTYCPTGTCTFALTDSSNEFSVANAGIGAAAFGGSSTLPVKSIVRSGTSATVTTTGNHGFTTGATVTISNAGQAEYNVTQAVTVTSSTTFTITGLPDYPVTPSAGTYTVAPAAGSTVSITSISRSSSTTGSKNSETVTVTTSAPHGFTTGSNIAISGATPSMYNYSGLPATVDTNSFTFPIAIEPNTSAVNIYQAQLSPTVYTAISNVSLTNPATGAISGSTSAAHRLHVGQTVAISVPNDTNSKYAGTNYTIATTPTSTTFTITGAGANVKNLSGVTATVAPDTSSVKTISVLSRAATTASATATAIGLPANFFGANAGDTKILNITKLSGSQANESAYVSSGVMITCANTGCTSFTYPITVTPAIDASGSMTVGLAGASSASLAAGAITRSGTTATVSGVTANLFTNGQSVNISASGTGLSSESAYLGTWTISCTAPCTSFTFGPVTLFPSTPATGSNITAYSGSTPPDRDTIIKWMRGADNYGDEKGPGGSITVRPSVHGDVLHSRPLVVNYGDSRGIVVFYGSNDGIYRAVNGNQTAAIGDVPAGGELWGLILPEHYNQITRLRLNSPELKFPATTLATAQPKDYFVDGPTGAYQKLTSSGTIDKAYLYLTMRRGGRFMYALDVSQPATPTVSWTISSGMTGFEELGQTWSRPRVTVLQREVTSTGTPTPYLIFGAGYDTAQDSEPPGTDSKGRGIFIVNATTGALIWSANPTCTTSATCRNVPSMTYAIPSDIAFVDRDGNGYTDKLYFPDVGGNIWRADVSDQDSANWTVTKVAALGCATGVCASGTTPRKFFFPPSVLSIKPAGAAGSYDALSIASGDREHPLKSTATGASYGVNDRFFMIMDQGTTVGGTATSGITPNTLFNATSATYDGSLNGFYINFATGEKAVNAPLAVNGTVFFGTNRPIDPLNTCAANLGEAKAYGVSPFLGTQTSNILPGGGLAPSAVSGLITIETTDSDGNKTSSEEKFCIGCGVGDPDKGGSCNSALENCLDEKAIAKNLRRTYWYKK